MLKYYIKYKNINIPYVNNFIKIPFPHVNKVPGIGIYLILLKYHLKIDNFKIKLKLKNLFKYKR